VISGKFVLFIAFLLCMGCRPSVEHPVSPPDDLIPRDEMIDIIVDFRLMEAILVTKQKSKAKDWDFTKYYTYNSVLEKHGITRERFERSHAYYQQDLKLMDEIYAEALARLSKMKSEPEKKE